MTKILVPVDFTKVSFSAFNYAVKLAEKLNAEVTLMHVINGSFATADSMFLETMDVAFEAAKNRLKFFAIDYSKKMGLAFSKKKFHYEVRFGVAGFTIADFANDNGYDYVVAGTRDNHNIVERILGTSSTIITKLTNCPIILIHENTRWMEPKKVIFTIDDKTDFKKSITDFLSFNKFFKAATDFIHIKIEGETKHTPQEAIIKELFRKEEPEFTFEVKNIFGGDIVQSIVDYSIFEKADMLVMVHRKKSFLASFFDRSISLKTAEGLHLPIMITAEQSSENL
ncbi:MAG: universal stress protein [Saprospiraceae bacterium]|nr:universal stress protein [Saprospiraceae bacterium]